MTPSTIARCFGTGCPDREVCRRHQDLNAPAAPNTPVYNHLCAPGHYARIPAPPPDPSGEQDT